MKFLATDLPEVIRIKPNVYGDDRGFFMETWQQRVFAENGIPDQFVQDNMSYSERGTLRGIHYQVKSPQGKLVRVVQGEVYDVAVDLRQSSSQFGQWVGVSLSDENKEMLWVPPGFGHAFLVTSETAIFEYKCTDFFAPDLERGIRWDDSEIGIAWPAIDGDGPRLSEKDANAASLSDAEVYE